MSLFFVFYMIVLKQIINTSQTYKSKTLLSYCIAYIFNCSSRLTQQTLILFIVLLRNATN